MSDQNFRLVMHNWIPAIWGFIVFISIVSCLAAIGWVCYMMGTQAPWGRGPMMDPVVGVITIVATVAGTFLQLVFIRIAFEFYIAVIRIAEDTRIARKIAEK